MRSKRFTTGGGAGAAGPAGKRKFYGALLTPGSAASALKIYDGTDNTGELKAELAGVANGASIPTPNLDILCTVGLYVEITGTAAIGYIYYD